MITTLLFQLETSDMQKVITVKKAMKKLSESAFDGLRY
jgi:hypothetical protein